MDRRSWPWKKKSSDKSEKTVLAADSAGSQADKDNYKKPTYVQISVESYTHLNGLEDQVKTYEQQVDSLEDQIKELNDKLSAANSEMTTKDNLVKQHAKVAEEAVSGWEKAEAEALALKNHLETVTLSKLTAEDRASHLDGALKECMRQIRNLKEEHEQKLQDVVLLKTKQCEKIKNELEAKIANLDEDLIRAVAENTALSRSLQERSNMVIKISEEKAHAEGEIELLRSNIESCEREINSLKYELHIAAKELEIRNEEKNMSMRSAEVANKQHMEGVKKITKLEAECQRLRGLVRKKLPGPAALAQMKLEVESLGRDYGDSRLRRSPVKPPTSPHLSAVSEFSLDNAQKFQKENDFLTERLLATEEETKMLKEALAKRNSELQASRNLCAKTASRLQSLEAQLRVGNQQKSSLISLVHVSTDSYSSQNMSKPSSVTSMSEDGNDDDRSCTDSWTASMISEMSHIKKEKSGEKTDQTKDVKHLELMDDFLEMEKLACINPNDVISTISDSPNNKTSVNGDVSGEVTISESQHVSDFPASHSPANGGLSAVDSASVIGQPPLLKLQSEIFQLLELMSKNTDTGKILEDIKKVLQDAHDALHQLPLNCVSTEVPMPDDVTCNGNGKACHDDANLTREKEITVSQDIKAARETLNSISQELATAISGIHDFVLFLGKEAMAVHDASSNGNGLNKTIEEFSGSFDKTINGSTSMVDFILDLSSVFAKASELRFNVLGYKGSEAEIYSPDCIDKVALPENKVLQRESSGERYRNGCSHISSAISNPEVPDDGNLVSRYGSNTALCKVSVVEFEELKLEKDNMAMDLARCSENLEMTKSQLHETEQLLAEAKSQLASAQKSNSLAETQLKCMAESYRSLEARAEELETEVNLLRTKAETLENELQNEKRCHWDSLSRCKELEDQVQRKESCSVCAVAAEADPKSKQESELAAAAEKLAECQETIFLLGKQLKSLRPQTEAIGSPISERTQRGQGLGEDEPTISGMNLHDFDQADTNATASTNPQRVGSESPVDLYNHPCSPSDTEMSLSRSPINSKYPKHRPTKSTSSSSSLVQTPDKHRGFSRFFSSKGRNGS